MGAVCLVGEAKFVSGRGGVDLDAGSISGASSAISGPTVLLRVGAGGSAEVVDLVLAVVLRQVEERRDLHLSVIGTARVVEGVVVVLAFEDELLISPPVCLVKHELGKYSEPK